MAFLFPGLMALLLILLIVFVVRFFRKAANWNPIQSVKDKISGWFGGSSSDASGQSTGVSPYKPAPTSPIRTGGTSNAFQTVANSPLNPLFPISAMNDALTGGGLSALNPFRR